LKFKENPRSYELDILRSKITKASNKCDKWTKLLKSELKTYANEGREMVEKQIKKFSKIKGEVYECGKRCPI
jgi:hypothetical protein